MRASVWIDVYDKLFCHMYFVATATVFAVDVALLVLLSLSQNRFTVANIKNLCTVYFIFRYATENNWHFRRLQQILNDATMKPTIL